MFNKIVFNVLKIIVKPIYKFLYRYKVNDKSLCLDKGGCIICCNHMSMVDPILLDLVQKRKIYFMAKSELFENKLVSGVIKFFGAFPVNRGRGDTTAISVAEDVLLKGDPLGIFIEGTRSKDGELLKPKSGAAMIAYKTGMPVLPVCITSEGGGKIRLFKKTIVSFSKPLTLEELGIKEGTPTEFRNASRVIMDNIRLMRERDINIKK